MNTAYLFSISQAGQVLVDNAGQQCLIGYPFIHRPRVSKIEVAPGPSQIHSLGLIERIASRLTGYLDFVFRVRAGAQLAALELVENVVLLRVHFVVHDGFRRHGLAEVG